MRTILAAACFILGSAAAAVAAVVPRESIQRKLFSSGISGAPAVDSPVLVQWFGAKGDGAANDTAAFVAAMAAAKHVVVPAGDYAVTGFAVPATTTLQLLEGARLLTSGSITIDASNAKFVGNCFGLQNSTGISTGCNVLWTGAVNSSVIKVGTSAAPVGCVIDGIAVYGNTSGCTGMELGAAGKGAAWCRFTNLSFLEFKYGVNVVAGIQQCYMSRIVCRNADGTAFQYAAGSIAFRVGDTVASVGTAITTLKVTECTFEAFEQACVVGSAAGHASGSGCQTLYLDKITVEGLPASGGCAFRFNYGSHLRVINSWIDASGNFPTPLSTRAFVIGSAADKPQAVYITGNQISSFGQVSIELIAFDGLSIKDNYISYVTANAVCVKNTGGGPTRRLGVYADNFTEPNANTPNEFYNNDCTGFVRVFRDNDYFNGIDNKPRPVERLGTAKFTLQAADIITLIDGSFQGVAFVIDDSNTYYGSFAIGGSNNRTAKISDPDSDFTTTKDSANRINVYYDGGSGTYKIQNSYGISKPISVALHEIPITP